MTFPCEICRHTYPALRLCSRCGPACAPCQQALDAARWRFVVTLMQPLSLHMDGTALWRLPFSSILPRARSIADAVDTAMHAAEEPINRAEAPDAT